MSVETVNWLSSPVVVDDSTSWWSSSSTFSTRASIPPPSASIWAARPSSVVDASVVTVPISPPVSSYSVMEPAPTSALPDENEPSSPTR